MGKYKYEKRIRYDDPVLGYDEIIFYRNSKGVCSIKFGTFKYRNSIKTIPINTLIRIFLEDRDFREILEDVRIKYPKIRCRIADGYIEASVSNIITKTESSFEIFLHGGNLTLNKRDVDIYNIAIMIDFYLVHEGCILNEYFDLYGLRDGHHYKPGCFISGINITDALFSTSIHKCKVLSERNFISTGYWYPKPKSVK